MADHVYIATVEWRRDGGDFAKGRYSRDHVWRFDGGIEVPASASPQVVPKAFVGETTVDSEEAFVASLSACHMLTFIDIARHAGFVVESYQDAAEGKMERLEAGRWWVSRVTLRPRIVFSGESEPSATELDDLHDKAHRACFIANSVKTQVDVGPLPGS